MPLDGLYVSQQQLPPTFLAGQHGAAGRALWLLSKLQAISSSAMTWGDVLSSANPNGSGKELGAGQRKLKDWKRSQEQFVKLLQSGVNVESIYCNLPQVETGQGQTASGPTPASASPVARTS